MVEETKAPPAQIENHGWRVVFSGMGINLALGILYTWSVISKGIPEEWGWTQSDKSMPYAIACLIFSLIMVPAGRMQDKLSPRLVATIGGILVGAGMIIASFTTSPTGYILGPWFRRSRRGRPWFWLCFSHTSGSKMVPSGKNRYDRRNRRLRLRIGLGICGTAYNISDSFFRF